MIVVIGYHPFYKLDELCYYVPTYYNNYVYTVESVASTIADKEGGIEPPIFIITRVYTNRIIIAITIFIIACMVEDIIIVRHTL